MQKYIAVIVAVACALVPEALLAAFIDPCPIDSLACPGGFADEYLIRILTNGSKYAFGGILFAMMIWYGFRLMLGSDNDSTISETYTAYAYAMIGTVLAGGAFTIANSFAVPGVISNQAPLNFVLFGVIAAIRGMLFIALVFNIFFQGYRLVTSQDDSQTEKAKKQFVYGMVGTVIAILADRLVFAVSAVNFGILSIEAIGVANFMGTVLGAFSVIALFVGGLWLILAVNEQNKDKAKKVILTALVILAITMTSLALIRLTASAPL